MECRYCKEECIKNGFYKNRVQRYCCRVCNKNQPARYLYKAYEKDTNEDIVKLLINGVGVRSISRIKNIAIGTVMSRIKNIASKIEKPILSLSKEYELDEMKTYVKNKEKKYWIVYAIDKLTKQVADFRVGKRSKRTMKPVIDTLLLSNANKIYTDHYPLYVSLIPSLLHKRRQYNINHIERKNLSVRTHLKRLSRKTICYSKSINMLSSCLRIYFWYSDGVLCKCTPG